MNARNWMAAVLLALTIPLSHAAAATPAAQVAPVDVYRQTSADIRAHSGGHRLLVLGEMHGTREIPLLVRQLVDDYSRDGTPVVLGLEVPTAQTAPMQAYLDSDGSPAARQRLSAAPFWAVADDQHDGRRSRDMLDLIDALRVLKASGRAVQVMGYDAISDGTDAQQRDDGMAQAVRRAYAALPATGRLLVLTGNVHAMLKIPEGAPKEMQRRPMASQLADLHAYTVNISARSGAFWGCPGRPCRPLSVAAMGGYTGASPRVYNGDDRQWHMGVWLPEFTVARLVE